MGTILPQTLLVSFPIPVRFCSLDLTNCQAMEANGAQCLSNAVPVNMDSSFRVRHKSGVEPNHLVCKIGTCH